MAKSEQVDSDYRHTAYKAVALTAELCSVSGMPLPLLRFFWLGIRPASNHSKGIKPPGPCDGPLISIPLRGKEEYYYMKKLIFQIKAADRIRTCDLLYVDALPSELQRPFPASSRDSGSYIPLQCAGTQEVCGVPQPLMEKSMIPV